MKLAFSKSISTQISLYSIDCVRKIFQTYHYDQREIFHLLDRARLAEASDDVTFWDKSYEVGKSVFENKALDYFISFRLYKSRQENESVRSDKE